MLPTDVRERSGFRGARPRKEGIGLGSGREILRRREGGWRGGRTVYEDEEGRDDLREDMLHVVVLDQVLGKAAIFGDWKLLLLSLSLWFQLGAALLRLDGNGYGSWIIINWPPNFSLVLIFSLNNLYFLSVTVYPVILSFWSPEPDRASRVNLFVFLFFFQKSTLTAQLLLLSPPLSIWSHLLPFCRS